MRREPVPSVLPLIFEAVADRPEALAVAGPDVTLTRAELAASADALARRLVALGVAPGALVALCVPRSAALVTGALGIVRAGAAFVAIDPAYPDERIRWILDDADVAAVVTDPVVDARLGASSLRPRIVLPGPSDAPGDGTLPGPPGPADIAYVVYTSGSTGEPKGVLVEHAGLANLVAWHLRAFDVGPDDRCSQIASPGFDAAVWEVWPSLAAGASLHVVPEALRGDPLGLRDWLVAERITVSFLPTAVAEGLIGLPWPADCALRVLLTGGDALTTRPGPDLPFAVINNYGLSETAVVATSGPVAPDGAGAPSIGRPIDGVTAEVVDERLRPVATGEAGELVIGGVAVGPGYLGRPALTAQRFLLDGPERRYRTGDHVRRRENGEIEFVGRLDDQLSIRGFRVEPGEVASALNAHPGVEASVAVGSGAAAARQLVAYLVAAGDPPAPGELDAFVGARLPEYMVPSRYVWLDELPVTRNGKIDRAALPDPAAPTAAAGNDAADGVQAEVVAIMAELLEVGTDEIGAEENFFLLGGHSMLGAQLIVRLERAFGVELSLRYLFDHPTPRQIAAEVERQVGEEAMA